jgi:hypothetical protein
MFLLDKWYLDVVTSRGDAVIAYAARLRWGAIRAALASVLVNTRDGAHRETKTVRGVESPRREGDDLAWRNAVLHARGQWRRDAPPLRRTLASTPEGTIRWTCHMPRALASLQVGDVTYAGLGYAERLRLTLPPGKLPFRTLRWGRHISDTHALVWIDWCDDGRHRWVWLDGTEQPDAVVTDAGVGDLAGGAALCVGDARDIVHDDVLGRVNDVLPALARRVAGPLAGMREHKEVARSSIVGSGRALDDGWTVREVVRW